MKTSFTKYMKSGYKVDDMAQLASFRSKNTRRVIRKDVKNSASRKFIKDHKGDDAWKNLADYLS